MVSKFHGGLESVLYQGLFEPEFYDELVYRLKKILGTDYFSAQLISHYKKRGYDIYALQQTVCLRVGPQTL